MLVLEELEHAEARGATIHGELVGYGSTADAFRITDTHPEGRGAAAAFTWRSPTPRSTPTTSTTSTPTARAPTSTTKSKRWPSRRSSATQAYKIPVSSTKSMMGHLIAAAGRDGADHLPAGDPRQRPSADDQLRNARPRLRPRLHPQQAARGPLPLRPDQQLRLRRPEHLADRRPLRSRTEFIPFSCRVACRQTLACPPAADHNIGLPECPIQTLTHPSEVLPWWSESSA